MLKLEEIVRLSKAYVNKCSEVKDEVNGWLRVTGEVQELVASRFGFKDQISNMFAVNLMRSAHTNYRDDPRFSEVSVYVRNNLAKKGNLSIGAEIPNVIINNLHGEDISLSTIIGDKDTVVISSSAT